MRYVIHAIIIAGLLGVFFCRSWNLEHEEPDLLIPRKKGVKTHLLFRPTWMFWILLFIFSLFLLAFGIRDGLLYCELLSVKVLLFLSVYFVLLLLLLPLLRKRFSARACATLWLVPTFLFWTFSTSLRSMPGNALQIYIPGQILSIIGIIWAAGFLAVGGYYLISHLTFRFWVKKHTVLDSDEEVCAVLHIEQAKLFYLWPVTLRRGAVKAPFSMGTTKRSRCIVLPDRSYTQAELSMIFCHELHHLQRSDVETKIFFCLCKAFCWFNPLVWIATRKAAEDLERSCDEIVTVEMEKPERQAYAKLLLDSAAPGQGCTTCLSAAAGTLRYRLKSIMDQRERWRGALLLICVVFVFVICFGLVSVSATGARGSITSLALTPEMKIRQVRHEEYGIFGSAKCDDEAFREALGKIEVEHVIGLEYPSRGGRYIDFDFGNEKTGRLTGSLTEQSLFISEWPGLKTIDCYLVKNKVDWDAIFACLYDFEENPFNEFFDDVFFN